MKPKTWENMKGNNKSTSKPKLNSSVKYVKCFFFLNEKIRSGQWRLVFLLKYKLTLINVKYLLSSQNLTHFSNVVFQSAQLANW